MSDISEIKGIFKRSTGKLNILNIIGIFSGIILSTLLFLCSFHPDFDSVTQRGAIIMLRILGGMGVLLTIGAYFETKGRNRKWTKIINVLENYPGMIVWAYKEITKANVTAPMSFNVGTFYKVNICLDDGTRELFLVKEDEAEKIMNYLKNNLKNISIGWDEELNKIYKINPRQLSQNPIINNNDKKTEVKSRVRI